MTNVQQEILDKMGREIQLEIDNGIMISLYVDGGWTEIKLPRFTGRHQAIDIVDWCEENIAEQEYANFGTTFLFKNSADAEWFTLRWMNT